MAAPMVKGALTYRANDPYEDKDGGGLVFGVRKDSPTAAAIVDTDTDLAPMVVDQYGRLLINLSTGGVTEYTEGATDATITGVAAMAEGPSDTLTPIQVDASKHVQMDIAADSTGIATSLAILDDWDEADRAKVNPIAGQAGVAAGAGAVDALTQRTTLASDDPAVALLGTIDTDTGAIVTGIGAPTDAAWDGAAASATLVSTIKRIATMRRNLAAGASPTDTLGTLLQLNASGNVVNSAASPNGIAGDTGDGRFTLAVTNFLYDGSAYPRQRSNQDVVLLASAARTATTPSADQTNWNGRGVLVLLNVTANPGGVETLTLELHAKLGGQYFTLTAYPAVTVATNAVYFYVFYPGAVETLAVANLEVDEMVLPKTWRANVVHSSTGSWTYAVDCSVIL